MESKHIRRDFNANVQKRVHYGEDEWLIEIYKNRADTVKTYLVNDVTCKKGKQKSWKAWEGYYPKSESDTLTTVSFEYEAIEDGNYRIDCMYSTTETTDALQISLNNIIKVDGVAVENDHDWLVYPQYNGRNCKTVYLKKGKHTITYQFEKTIFLGAIVRKIETYKGDNKNKHFLTIKTFEFRQANDLSVDEFECNIQYWHKLDDETNISGYLFDFSDEVNFYIKAPNGKMKQLFGGYISTVTVDNDLKLMTLHCASRLRDLEHRYCYPNYVLLGGDKDTIQFIEDNAYYDLDNYSQVLQHLLTHSEVPIRSNLIDTAKLREVDYSRNPYLKFYGSKRDEPLVKKYVDVLPFSNSIMVRNSPNTQKYDSLKLFDSKGKAYDISKNPTFFIQYGMGEAKYEGVADISDRGESSSSVVGTAVISTNVRKQAEALTIGTGIQGFRDLKNWIHSHITGEYNISDFYQKPSTTLKRRRGNCCCQTELLLDMAYVKGLMNNPNVKAYYGHDCNGKGQGHVYAIIHIGNTKYIVDSTNNLWNQKSPFSKRIGASLCHKTRYPKKPF